MEARVSHSSYSLIAELIAPRLVSHNANIHTDKTDKCGLDPGTSVQNIPLFESFYS